MKYRTTSIGFAVLAACSPVGPDYVPPDIVLPAQFIGNSGTAFVRAADIAWWERLDQPVLNALVTRGAAQNLDVAFAIERIRAADAALGQTGLNGQVGGTITADITRSRFDDQRDTRDGVVANASYVLDLFGGVRRGREQALATFDAAQLDAGTARLAYLSEITSAYIQARYFQNAASILRDTIQSRRKTLSLVSQLSDSGDATLIELQQARALLATAEAALPMQTANFEVNAFRIATLLAEPAAPILQQMSGGASQPRPSGITTVGVPADLLRNRPDVRAAERNLAAAVAAVGVSEAQLRPSVALLGTVGIGTGDGWSFGPTISIPVFNRGVLRANRGAAESQARAAELAWRNRVLIAMEDVQTALTLCRNWYRQMQAAQRAVEATGQLVRLTQQSYEQEALILDDVLDAQRQDSENRLALANATRNYTLAWMQVQVATGQGWRTDLAPGWLDDGPPQTTGTDPAGLYAEPVLIGATN